MLAWGPPLRARHAEYDGNEYGALPVKCRKLQQMNQSPLLVLRPVRNCRVRCDPTR